MSGSVLFDEPGPRGKRRIRIASVVTVVVLAAVVFLALRQFASHGQLDAARWEPFGQWPIWSYLLVGLRGTQAQIDAAQAASHIFLAEDNGKTHSSQVLLYGKDNYAHVSFVYNDSGEQKQMEHDIPIAVKS